MNLVREIERYEPIETLAKTVVNLLRQIGRQIDVKLLK